MSTTAIANTITVREVCKHRDLAVTKMMQAADLMREAQEHFNAAQRRANGYSLMQGNEPAATRFTTEGAGGEGMKRVVKRIDSVIWSGLMDVAGIKRMMSSSQYEAKMTQIYDNPEVVSITTVNDIVKRLHANANDIFEQSVVDVFKSLNPGYKSHKRYAFTKKLIMHNALGQWYTWATHGDYDKKLADLHRVLCIVRGEPPIEHVERAMLKELQGKGGEYKDAVIRCVGYQNGNVHVHVHVHLQQSDVDALNSILAGAYGRSVR